jgi:hypothetical protein
MVLANRPTRIRGEAFAAEVRRRPEEAAGTRMI